MSDCWAPHWGLCWDFCVICWPLLDWSFDCRGWPKVWKGGWAKVGTVGTLGTQYFHNLGWYRYVFMSVSGTLALSFKLAPWVWFATLLLDGSNRLEALRNRLSQNSPHLILWVPWSSHFIRRLSWYDATIQLQGRTATVVLPGYHRPLSLWVISLCLLCIYIYTNIYIYRYIHIYYIYIYILYTYIIYIYISFYPLSQWMVAKSCTSW